ncbi:MAG: AAA family ATPase [Oscillospiraceae bacterium]|nr:AAA family ATPase [Oscillospiraceae bacterium]
MKYIESFTLASDDAEVGFILSFNHKMTMQCYSDNVYPFKIFPQKRLRKLDFSQITILYGGNGSGKSTLMNIVAQKLGLERSAPFNNTPFFEDYLNFCDYELVFGKKPPRGSKIITSDNVFDYLLNIRALNEGVDDRREKLFDEYTETNKPLHYHLKSLADYEELKRINEAKHKTKSAYVSRRLPENINGKSNGESAFAYFTQEIKENALYFLDEPENSLSVKLQIELIKFIEDSARFFGCQFFISTHSPFLLSVKEARIYDLDSVPVRTRQWTELENVRMYHDFFEKHRDEF